MSLPVPTLHTVRLRLRPFDDADADDLFALHSSVYEGTLREDCVVNGEVSDSWVFGLIRREWRPLPEPVPAR